MKKQSFPCAALVLSLALAGCGSTDEVVGTVAALEQRQWNTTNQSRGFDSRPINYLNH